MRVNKKDGLPIGWRMVPIAVKDIPHECWDEAAKAFQEANTNHGFYESCFAAYHAFLDKLEESQNDCS